MNARPLNLLRHPRRSLVFEPAHLRAVLLALGAGAVMGCAWGMWQQMQHEALLAQRSRLQVESRVWRSQQALQSTERDRQRLLTSWGQRAQSWQRQREQRMQLHEALLAQAASTGLRVERWQGDARQLVLQAWLPRADDVPEVLSGLSQAWPTGWTLQSIGDRAGAGVDVVLQAAPLAGAHDGDLPKP